MKKLLLLLLVSLGLSLPAQAYPGYYSRGFGYHGFGYRSYYRGGYGYGGGPLFLGLAAFGTALDLAAIAQANSRPVTSSPYYSAPVPFGYLTNHGSIRSPWSSIELSVVGLVHGQYLLDPTSGQPFRVP